MAAKYSTNDEEVKHISTERTSGIGEEVEDDLENVDIIKEVEQDAVLKRLLVKEIYSLFMQDLKKGKMRQGL